MSATPDHDRYWRAYTPAVSIELFASLPREPRVTKQAVWALESIVTVAVVLGLVYTAKFQYSRALVDPGFPEPDYTLQASISYVGIAVVIGIATVLTLRLTRHPSPRAASAVGGAVIIISSGVAIAVVAMLLASIRHV